MPGKDHKTVPASSAFCGFRLDTDSDSDTTPTPSLKDEPTTPRARAENQQQRPQSLTLPFDNRERDSHLVTEEEFDQIVRQAHLDNPLPPLPPSACDNLVGGLQRPISIAKNGRFPLKSPQKARPASTDVSKVMAMNSAHHHASKSISSMPRDPTLTALPRPPTKNDLAVYPTPGSSAELQGLTEDIAGHWHKSNSKGVENLTKKKSHKRNLSYMLASSNMIESVKKRFKQAESPGSIVGNSSSQPIHNRMPINGHDNPSVTATSQNGSIRSRKQPHLAVRPLEEIQAEMICSSVAKPSSDPYLRASSLAPPSSPSSSSPSLLRKTWHKTKHHASKLSISMTASQREKDRPSIFTPISITPLTRHTGTTYDLPLSSNNSLVDNSRDTPTPVPSTTSTSTTTTATGYHASAEQSSTLSKLSHPSQPILSNTRQTYEFISGPQPKKSLTTRLGVPPSKQELNTTVTRQQNRIVDLTLQNDVLCGQIQALRNEMQGLKIGQDTNSSQAEYLEEDGRRGIPTLRRDENMQDLVIVENTHGNTRVGDGSRARSGRVIDTRVWQEIWGVPDNDPQYGGWKREKEERLEKLREEKVGPRGDGEDGDLAMEDGAAEDSGWHDKRKTWMTCDS